MKIVAIWNPASGSAPDENDLRSALDDDCELVSTTAEDPGPGQTRQAVEDGATTVVACGGDGTIRACIEPLLDTAAALDMVPLGTGNLLAANLAVPSGLEAAPTAGQRPKKTIDVGIVNGEPFAVMAGSGFDAVMIRDADDEMKSRFGTVAYLVSAAKHLGDALHTTTVVVDDERWFSGRTSMVLVGNHGVVSGGLKLFPDASADDGKLDVAVLSAKSLRDWGSVLWRLLREKPQRSELVQRTQAETIVVTTKKPRPYELDGEDRPPTKTLSFSIRPQSLHVHHGEDI